MRDPLLHMYTAHTACTIENVNVILDSDTKRTLNIADEWLTLLFCIQEIPDSNLSLETGYPDYEFSLFSSVPLGKCWDSILN
jgi:hypothetical protein